jgi:hypothetical protein
LLKDHAGVFACDPASLDVMPAVTRWLQEIHAKPALTPPAKSMEIALLNEGEGCPGTSVCSAAVGQAMGVVELSTMLRAKFLWRTDTATTA